ncbi:restriction endonuclease [Salinigranum halophilum]|uniref:restriction endonuclease n=1 Tax=Salinigranum halophilum TaxID=2565931 RepID=UPI00115F0B78|nr:restriction endonuclease [Salinigranum halophilum]
MSERVDEESVADRLTTLEEAVERLEARLDALETVSAEMTSKEEKYAVVLELAFAKHTDSETVSVGPHEIRECTDVSRRYAYDMIDAMGTSIVGCEVRDSDVVETITGTRRRSKALLVDCTVVRSPESVTQASNPAASNMEGAEPAATSADDGGVPTVVELDVLTGLTPRGFEEYVADLWGAQGYSCRLTKQTRDSGVDVIAENERDHVLIQVKRYTERDVGIETVQRVAGLLVDDEFEASRVIVVTTSGFTADAKQRGERIGALELVDGSEVVARGRERGLSLHGEDHGYETELTDEQVLSVLDCGEPVTTVEVADALGTNSRSVLVNLESLVETGEVRVKRVGDEYGV